MSGGKFFVIEGQDGTGKETQARLLLHHLEEAKAETIIMDFPQYGKNSAWLIERYLRGEEGTVETIDPRLASLYFTIDRLHAAPRIRESLSSGTTVIANRYTASNAGHQGGKFRNRDLREQFFRWLWTVEFEKLGIPKPDVNFLLVMPIDVSMRLMEERLRNDPGRIKDKHESNEKHLRDTHESYLHIADLYPDEFIKIECVRNEELLSREEIHKEIWTHVSRILPIDA